MNMQVKRRHEKDDSARETKYHCFKNFKKM